MYIKKDGFLFYEYISDAIIAEDSRIGAITAYINQNNISHIIITGRFSSAKEPQVFMTPTTKKRTNRA